MPLQSDIPTQARTLRKELDKLGVKIKPSQARAIATKVWAGRDLQTDAPRSRQPDARLLAQDHAVSQMFSSLGRYGNNPWSFFDELDAAYALADPNDTKQALIHLFDTMGAPVLLPHVIARNGYADLRGVFQALVDDALRLIQRTLCDSKALLETNPHTLFVGPLHDWRSHEGVPVEFLEDPAQRHFEGRIERNGSQFFIDIATPSLTGAHNQGGDQLSLLVEIRHGRPCVHVSSQIHEDPELSVFGTTEGAYVCLNKPHQVPSPEAEFAQGIPPSHSMLVSA